jgi:hypothetical protein
MSSSVHPHSVSPHQKEEETTEGILSKDPLPWWERDRVRGAFSWFVGDEAVMTI